MNLLALFAGATLFAATPVDRASLVGHWAPSPSCEQTVTFEANGVARVSDDERSGRWAVDGDRLTVTPPPGQNPIIARVSWRGEALVVAAEGQENLVLTRCEAPAPAPASDR